jgi:hypothetical protein
VNTVSWVPVRKIAAVIIAAVVSAGPLAILDAVGVHIDQALGVLIVAVLTSAAGYLTPAKSAAPADSPAPPPPPIPPAAPPVAPPVA